MEIGWLEDFLALVSTLNFSRAAENRNISQPAFSRRIRMLESWLRADLFTRETHKIELTKAGEYFSPMAQEMLRRIYLVRKQVQELASSETDTLRFASTHALSVTFFPSWLEEIEAETQLAATVSLITDNMTGCERLMLQGEAQFLLCHHHGSAEVSLKPNYFRSLIIGADTLIPVSAPGEAGDGPRFLLPGNAANPVPYVSYSKVSGMGRIIEGARASGGSQIWLSTVFSSHVAAVVASMARAGRGAAWLPISLISEELEKGLLVRAGDEHWDIPIEIRIYRPRARQTPKAEEFWSMLNSRAAHTAV